MAYRRPAFLDRRPTQAIPFSPQSAYQAPHNPFMPNEFSPVPGIQPKPQGPPPAPKKPAYRKPAPNPIQGAATRAPMPSPQPAPGAPAAPAQPSMGGMDGLMSLMNGGMDPDQMKQMQEQFRKRMDESVSRRRNLLDQMQQRYDDAKGAKLGIDWTPGLALADMMNRPFTPTNMAQTYMQSGLRPENQRQKDARLLQMEQAMLGEERGLANTEIQSMQGTGMGGNRGLMSFLREKMKRDEIRDLYETRRDDTREEKNIRKTFESLGKISDKMADGRNDLAMVVDGLNDGSIARVEFAISKLTRLAGQVGVLTEKDLDLTRMNTLERDLRAWEGYIKGDPTVQVPDRIKTQMKAAVADMVKSMKDATMTKIKGRQNRMEGISLYGLTKGQTDKMFQSTLGDVEKTFVTPFGGKSGGAKTDAELNKMSEAELDAYLKKLESK